MRYLNQGGKISAILTEAVAIERHLHNRERWFGISLDQSGDDWALRGTLNPFVLTSGAADWGAWAKILGPDDTPAIPGMVSFDGHRVLVTDMGAATPFIIQVAQGPDADVSLAAGLFTEFMIVAADAVVARAGGAPFDIITRRVPAGTQVWARTKCATADTIDLFVGIHEYED